MSPCSRAGARSSSATPSASARWAFAAMSPTSPTSSASSNGRCRHSSASVISVGRVICITSLAVKEPSDNLSLSNSIRPGVTGWAKSLSRELGPKGITVNCVAPGRIDTPRMHELYGPSGPPRAELDRIPLRRLGAPREFGDVVCFLASERAGYVTGTTVLVDGGSSRSLL